MSTRSKPTKFRLVEIDDFDARRGYKRCTLPGVSVFFPRPQPNPRADFWRDRTGCLVVRFSCGGYVLHLAATTASGKQVSDADIDDFDKFGHFVADTLFEWVVEGVDDLPSSIYEAM